MRERRAVLAVYLLLTLLVWGLFALDRGPWQDDADSLGHVIGRQGLDAFLAGGATETRVLKSVVYAAAILTPWPVYFLQICYGAMWLGIGITADRLARELFGGDRGTAFVAGALTLTATSDLLTNSLVSLGYQLSTLTVLAAQLQLLRFASGGSRSQLFAALAFLSWAIWTNDGALVPALMTPAIVWASGGRVVPDRRTRVATLLWLATLVPYLVVFGRQFQDRGYAAHAILDLSPAEWSGRALSHFAYNFTPWRWAFARPRWSPQPPEGILPIWLFVACAAVGTLAVLAVLRRRPPAPPDPGSRPWRWIVAALLATALAANTAYAKVHVSHVFYRTHTVSRVFVSLALAAVVALLWSAASKGRLLRQGAASMVVAAFVALGIWGGVERQDYFLSAWRQHRAELLSILQAVPRLPPQATLVLRIRPSRTFRSTGTAYLGRSWAKLLYDDDDVASRTIVWSRRDGCRAERGGLVCETDSPENCAAFGCSTVSIPLARIILLEFSSETGRYQLSESLPGALQSVEGGDYSPGRLIQAAPWTPLARSLLTSRAFLARFFIADDEPRAEPAKPTEQR